MVFEVSATAAETQTRVEALVSQITATLLSGTNIALFQYSCVLFCSVLFTMTFFFCYSADTFNLIWLHIEDSEVILSYYFMPTMYCPAFPSLSCLSNMLHFDPFREERNNAPSNFRSRSRCRRGHLCRQRGGLQLHKIQSYGQVTSLLLSSIILPQ